MADIHPKGVAWASYGLAMPTVYREISAYSIEVGGIGITLTVSTSIQKPFHIHLFKFDSTFDGLNWFIGRRFYVGTIDGQKIIAVMCGLAMVGPLLLSSFDRSFARAS